MSDGRTFASRLRWLRKGRGMTQRELGARLYVSNNTVSQWEAGRCTPALVFLEPLADALCVTVGYLVTGRRDG